MLLWCTDQFLKKKVSTNTYSILCFGSIAGSHKSDDGARPCFFGARERGIMTCCAKRFVDAKINTLESEDTVRHVSENRPCVPINLTYN